MGALAAANIGGSVIGGVMGAVGQNQQNQANIGLQNASENWMEHMSDTSHQREVSDLKAAGLNPILSANGGASTPSAPPVSVGSPVGAGLAGMESGLSSAIQLAKGMKDIDVADSQKKLNEANATVATKNAGIKSAESDVMTDVDTLYKGIRQGFLKWYNGSGLNQTSAPKAYDNSIDFGRGGYIDGSSVPANAGGGLQ